MASILPHSSAINKMRESYLKDAFDKLGKSFENINDFGEYRNIFKTALAFDAVLSKLNTTRIKPSLSSLRAIVKRVPLLIALRQISSAKKELRQLIELVFWAIFFSDHKIEWANLLSNPDRGHTREAESPISSLANREINFYINYAKELFADEPSGLSQKAINTLNVERNKLNFIIHPTSIIINRLNIPPFEILDQSVLREFKDQNRVIMSQSCVLLSSYNRNAYNKLPALHRSWFDWLVGPSRARSIRSNDFGLR